jgi:NarL family two-component system response regulator LiaR
MAEGAKRWGRIQSASGSLNSSHLKRVLLYGVLGGALIALLEAIEYKHFVHEYPGEVYGGLVAVIFTVVGVYAGLRWTKRTAPQPAPPAIDGESARLKLGITPREYEILRLIADGLSNREIGERLFVSENTVKTHSSRLFDKMSVNRRVQAVQKGRELGLIQ